MKKSLSNFLFGESQVDSEISALVESISDMDVEDGGIKLTVNKKPLAAALRAIGIDDGGLESDPRGMSLIFTDVEDCRAAHRLLVDPPNMHKLAELGWVCSVQGDVSQLNEPAECRLRFLEIDNIEPENPKPDANAKHPARVKKVSDIIKKGREFATTAPDHDDDLNPVEFDDKSGKDNQKGVSKAKDGAQPKGKAKGSTSESFDDDLKSARQQDVKAGAKLMVSEWVKHALSSGLDPKDKEAYHKWAGNVKESYQPKTGEKCHCKPGEQRDNCPDCEGTGKKIDFKKIRAKTQSKKGSSDEQAHAESLSEGAHKEGCQCGFCRNKGKIGDWSKRTKGVSKVTPGDDSEMAVAGGEEESLQSPDEIVNALLEKSNPGTPPGIMGHKSYSKLKLPKGGGDRKFKPAAGMVQPDNTVVKKQVRRRVNKGK